MKAIIPTGGRGTRMQPLTFSTNKHFIPVANKPLIFYPIESIADVGIKDIAITYNSGWLEKVKDFLGNGSKWGLKFTYILQEKPLGLANIFQECEAYLAGDSFLMHLGDNIFTEGIKDLVDYFLKEKSNGLVAMVRHSESWRLGVPYFDKKGRLKRYVEKPKRKPPHNFAIPGLYFFDKNVFKCFRGKDKIKPSSRGEYEISSPYQWLIDHGYRVDVVEYKGKWLDPGKFGDWIEANQHLLDHNSDGEIQSKPDRASTIQGRASIGKRCKIRNSKIRGPVIIGDEVVIKNAYIGPYTSISDGCVIENARLENSVLMQGVKIINVGQPIDNSLIGTDTEVSDVEGHSNCIELFVGERSQVRL
jgi:glucose-1-phosphate thymidylyltransferase